MVNPLLDNWQSDYQLPVFEDIQAEHFLPAFERAFVEHNAEINLIAESSEKASFENTIEAIEKAGATLDKISPVFYILTAADTNDDLIALQTLIVPKHTAHLSAIYTRADLYKRVKEVFDSAPNLDQEQSQLLEQTYTRFIRNGAHLNTDAAKTILSLDDRLAQLETLYGQNVLKDSNKFELLIEDETDLAGLPASVCEIAANEAADRGHAGKHLFTISRSSITPFLQFSARRELREKMWKAYTQCADNNNDFDNKKLAEDISILRAERANILGFDSHAAYMLGDRMAGTPQNVRDLLDQLWLPATAKAKDEKIALQAYAQSEGENFEIAPWDWRYYTEKVRKEKFNFDTENLKPYFELKRVRQGAFDVATKLFNISFTAIPNLISYHPDTEAFEVKEEDGSLIGIFITDYFMRPSKKSGAWMNALRSQHVFGEKQYPVVFNTCNFPKTDPALLNMEEVRTLFHEFGHALHGLLSKVKYKSLSGTSVKRDFVELPSQIMEHWAVEPEVLRDYAKHIETNEIIPDEFIEKISETQTFNQGFATTEYLAASYLDLKWHEIKHGASSPEANKFEVDAMSEIALLKEISPRYRSTYFQHIFSGGYSAGYYAYIWAEVLDADAYEEFKQKGIFDSETAKSFRKNILERGGTEDPMKLYKRFKGRDPQVEPLMKARGLS